MRASQHAPVLRTPASLTLLSAGWWLRCGSVRWAGARRGSAPSGTAADVAGRLEPRTHLLLSGSASPISSQLRFCHAWLPACATLLMFYTAGGRVVACFRSAVRQYTLLLATSATASPHPWRGLLDRRRLGPGP